MFHDFNIQTIKSCLDSTFFFLTTISQIRLKCQKSIKFIDILIFIKILLKNVGFWEWCVLHVNLNFSQDWCVYTIHIFWTLVCCWPWKLDKIKTYWIYSTLRMEKKWNTVSDAYSCFTFFTSFSTLLSSFYRKHFFFFAFFIWLFVIWFLIIVADLK